jgi:hypothetical protein
MKAAKQSPGRPAQSDLVHTYEQLMQFNQHCIDALGLIEAFGQQHLIPRTEHRYYCALLEELRASTSQSVMEYLDQQEISAAAAASRRRLKIEKQMFT